MVHSDDKSGKELSDGADGQDKSNPNSGNGMQWDKPLKGRCPWPITNIILSLLCIIWIIDHKANLGIRVDWIPNLMFMIGSMLALIAGLVFYTRFITNSFTEHSSLIRLKVFLVILPFLLIWAPAPYGVIFTPLSEKADGGAPVCMNSTNVKSDGTTESVRCIRP